MVSDIETVRNDLTTFANYCETIGYQNARDYLEGSLGALGRLEAELTRLREENERLRERLATLLEDRETLLDQDHTNELQREVERLRKLADYLRNGEVDVDEQEREYAHLRRIEEAMKQIDALRGEPGSFAEIARRVWDIARTALADQPTEEEA